MVLYRSVPINNLEELIVLLPGLGGVGRERLKEIITPDLVPEPVQLVPCHAGCQVGLYRYSAANADTTILQVIQRSCQLSELKSLAGYISEIHHWNERGYGLECVAS